MAGLAEIFRRHGPDYRARFAQRMPQDQLRAMRDIEQCRTPRRGGHVWRCPKCGERRFSFHSCGNRHCPACGGDDAHRWLVRQQALQLPVTYHLSTFTVPEALRAVIRSHPREGLALLFHASSTTLLDLCAGPRGFGGTPGLTGVLHTWTRLYLYHPHVHYLVTGGASRPTDLGMSLITDSLCRSWRSPGSSARASATACAGVCRRCSQAFRQTSGPGIGSCIPNPSAPANTRSATWPGTSIAWSYPMRPFLTPMTGRSGSAIGTRKPGRAGWLS